MRDPALPPARRRRGLAAGLCLLVAGMPAAAGRAGDARQAGTERLHGPLDEILDLYVRDGYVYYQALRLERGRLDRYVASLDVGSAVYARWSPSERAAFWLNAYNALVLRTVIDHYPIRRHAPGYPPDSIRQIPGAFDRLTHRAAGRTVTLDQIEHTILPEFRDPRLYLALGRGAVGSGRLRSEAYASGRLATQLDSVEKECATRSEYLRLDRANDRITMTPILGWHEAEFVAAYDPGSNGAYAHRGPIERAVLALFERHLFPSEREYLRANTFTMSYHEFDWRLNDLTGGRR